MDDLNTAADFDHWADNYDADVGDETGFPFAGYEAVLERVLQWTAAAPGMDVLELGPGTGNLTARLAASGAAVWALDFSAEMLARARAKAPAATFAQAHLLGDYPPEFHRRYHRVVATYVFHEFPDEAKLALLRRLAAEYLQPGGLVVIGDIGFPDAAARERGRAAAGAAWDEEHYWVMDAIGPRLRGGGWSFAYDQVSAFGLALRLLRGGADL